MCFEYTKRINFFFIEKDKQNPRDTHKYMGIQYVHSILIILRVNVSTERRQEQEFSNAEHFLSAVLFWEQLKKKAQHLKLLLVLSLCT